MVHNLSGTELKPLKQLGKSPLTGIVFHLSGENLLTGSSLLPIAVYHSINVSDTYVLKQHNKW